MNSGLRTRRCHRLALLMAVVTALAVLAPAQLADASVTERFLPVDLSHAASDQVSTDLTSMVADLYNEFVVDGPTREGPNVPRDLAPEGAAAEIADGINMSERAQADLAKYARSLKQLGADSAIPELGFEPDPVASVDVSVNRVVASVDETEGKRVVKATVLVVTHYEGDGPSTEEQIDYLIEQDPDTNEYQSFKPLDLEAVANAPGNSGLEGSVPAFGGEESSILPDFDGPIPPERSSLEASDVSGVPGFGIVSIIPRGLTGPQKKKIAVYAEKYALSPNPAYKKWAADCTNFVSQAMRAGGWTMTGGNITRDTHYWWYKSTGTTWSWINADSFHDYATKKSKRTKILSSVWRLNPGDVLQYRLKAGKPITHSMVVTNRDKKGEVYLSYHSNNTRNKRLTDILKTKAANWYAHWV